MNSEHFYFHLFLPVDCYRLFLVFKIALFLFNFQFLFVPFLYVLIQSDQCPLFNELLFLLLTNILMLTSHVKSTELSWDIMDSK